MSEYFEKAALTWDDDPNRKKMAQTIADAMIHQINPKRSEIILDYGTGTGNLAIQFSSSVKKIFAADSSKKMLEVLRDKLSSEHIQNIEPIEWSFEQEKSHFPLFDFITLSMTLHHIKDIKKAITTFHSLLIPGGIIAIADLDLDNGEFHEGPGIAEHYGFDRNSLTAIVKSAGFENISIENILSITKNSSKTKSPREFSIFLLTGKKL